MKVCVLGLWHLGSVTAACAASLGHDVVGYDPDAAVVDGLLAGKPPIGEPGLPELIDQQRNAGRLTFTATLTDAVAHADAVWVTFDTPVDDDDRADVDSVVSAVEQTYSLLPDNALILVSSQLPVGTTQLLRQRWESVNHGRRASFAYSPENLRLGTALDVFMSPDRIVVGCQEESRAKVGELFGELAGKILWMSVESAEMTKHAVNAFLATSVTFINEIARLCEMVGADAAQVERGLKTEARIGPKAYLGPGAAFAGGTLARDVQFLREIGIRQNRSTPFLDGLAESNARHRTWALDRLDRALQSLAGRRIAVWGLTYKAGTTTLRRSDAVILCNALIERGATVVAHDPTVKTSPTELDRAIEVCSDPIQTAADADALVVATGWPLYRDVAPDRLFLTMKHPVVVDANRLLGATIGADTRFEYFSVGRHH